MKHAALRRRSQTHEAQSAIPEPRLAAHPSGNHAILQLQGLIGNRRTQQVLQKSVQRQATDPFANELPLDKERRLKAIESTRQAIERVTMVVGGGYLYEFEHLTQQGINQSKAPSLDNLSIKFQETFEQRETRLRTLVAVLIHVLTRLESQPIPADEFTLHNAVTHWERTDLYERSGLQIENFDMPGGVNQGHSIVGTMLAHIQKQQGQSLIDVYLNLDAINHEPLMTRRVPRGRISAGASTGIYIAVPDPVNRPMEYQRVSSRPLTPGIILDVWHDDMGFYYLYKKQRHYLPERP